MDLRYYVFFPLTAGLAYHLYKKKYADRITDERTVSTQDRLGFLHQQSIKGYTPHQRYSLQTIIADPDLTREPDLKLERLLASRSEKFHSLAPCVFEEPLTIA